MSDEQPVMTIERVSVLNGHTSAETAYVVEDYPYGYRLRCKIRYWIETAEKGSAKGQQRFVSQTTNPKKEREVWNKPKASTYSSLAAMYLDENEHVRWLGVDFHLSPVADARCRLMGIYEQFTERDREVYGALLKRSHNYVQQWHEWEEKVHAISLHIQETGTDPKISNGTWKSGDRLYYLGDGAAMYVATARQRLQQS